MQLFSLNTRQNAHAPLRSPLILTRSLAFSTPQAFKADFRVCCKVALAFSAQKNPLPVGGVSPSLFLPLSPEFWELFFASRLKTHKAQTLFQHLKRFKDRKSSFDDTSAVKIGILSKIELACLQVGTFSGVKIKNRFSCRVALLFFARQKTVFNTSSVKNMFFMT